VKDSDLKALAEAATPGPWQVFVIASDAGISERVFAEGFEGQSNDICHIPMQWPKSGGYIAAANPAEILRRLKEKAVLLERIAKLRTALINIDKLQGHEEENLVVALDRIEETLRLALAADDKEQS
jgi:hypothetical protein